MINAIRSIACFVMTAALISGCSTPLEQCLNNAQSDWRAAAASISEIEGNIARGYAIHTQTVPYTYQGVCYSGTLSYACPMTGYRTQETPVAVDVNQERQKLAALRKNLPNYKKQAAAASEQCRAAYPE